ncbi:hypothetical protein TNCV_4067801 [Trichonephila clavipes]|nr:hypothetical protein TNCV_4067801 [Trichonephila clavipes]
MSSWLLWQPIEAKMWAGVAWVTLQFGQGGFSGYKFRSSSAKGAYRSSAPRARNELKSAVSYFNIMRKPP